MKVLVVGSGGREHALAWKIAQSPAVTRLVVAPGSDAIAQLRRTACAPIAVTAIDQLVDFAARERVDLTVVGPEAPLVAGIVDRFQARGLTIFGPTAAAARLEGSKVFAKQFMAAHGIPTAAYHLFDDPTAACRFAEQHPGTPWVVKADGLAAGKGVLMPPSPLPEPAPLVVDTAGRIRAIATAFGPREVLEERLQGEEASVIGLSDGARLVLLESAQDHKRLGDGDTGPNTGGMGACSPAPAITASLSAAIRDRIMAPTIEGMAREGQRYHGALYAGLMITEDGPKVLEYNVRFGDPETQAILPRLRSDLAPLLLSAAEGRLQDVALQWDPRPCVCIVLASAGYPGARGPSTDGRVITGIEAAMARPDTCVFHAGTRRRGDQWVTTGGRVLNMVAFGATYQAAIRRAYEAVADVHFEGMQYRRDIGTWALSHEHHPSRV